MKSNTNVREAGKKEQNITYQKVLAIGDFQHSQYFVRRCFVFGMFVVVMMMSVMVMTMVLVMMLMRGIRMSLCVLTVRQLYWRLQCRLQSRDVHLRRLVHHVVMRVQMGRGGHRIVLCRSCLCSQGCNRCGLVVVVIMILVVVFGCVVIKARAEDVVGL